MADDPIKFALEQLGRNFSCAQSVLSAFGPRYGMSEETALKTAACFGAGMARLGRACGAVTGALMVLGLEYGATDSSRESKELAYRKGQEFIRAFKEKHGTTVCRELVGYDLADDAQLQQARDGGAFIKICLPLVKEAVELLMAMLPEAGARAREEFTTENTKNPEEEKKKEIQKDKINEITSAIIGAAIKVHRSLGPGLLESTYEECLCHELAKIGIPFLRQMAVPIEYQGMRLDCGYRLDLLVAGCVVVEIKSVKVLEPIHEAQLMTYLKLGGWPAGLLLNFNVQMLKQGIIRKMNVTLLDQ